jgi:hypothetical protein
VLQEGVVKRERGLENESRKFMFSLKDTQDVTEVRFFLSVISGDCLLSSALDRRNHSFQDSGVKYAFNHSLRYNEISRQYYLQVKCFANSFFSVVAQVTRAGSSSADDNLPEPLALA